MAHMYTARVRYCTRQITLGRTLVSIIRSFLVLAIVSSPYCDIVIITRSINSKGISSNSMLPEMFLADIRAIEDSGVCKQLQAPLTYIYKYIYNTIQLQP